MKHRCSLTHIERAALGDVSGKSLLHLQCHFGQDTLSWAQLGANVVGVDYSPNAIAAARVLAKSMNLPAEFIESNVYDLPRHHHKQYDIVFTSYGVLKWLADIRGWAEVVAHFLAPGGLFYLVEFHPFLYVFDYDHATELTYPYFSDAAGTTYTEHGSYARPEMATTHTAHAWNHPTSEVITALLAAGLSIEEFREYPYSTLDCFPFVRMGGHERYVHQTHPEKVPMLYSVAARRPAEAPCSK